MKAVMFGLVLTLVMGCGKKEETEPQGQKKAPAKAAVQRPGTVLWEFKTGDYVFSSPALGTDGILYVGSSDTKVYAIQASNPGLAKSPWPMRGQNAQHTGLAPATK